MKTIDELATEVVEYEYEVRPYEMNDCYDSKEEAYNNFYDTMANSENGLLTEMMEEIDMLLKYEDLSDPILKKQYDDCTRICYDLNIYLHGKNKSEDMDI